MTWDYRVVRRVFTHKNGETEFAFGIREVYYNEDGSICLMSQNDMHPYGESLGELRGDLAMMTEALDKDVLFEEDVEFKEIMRDDDPDEVLWGAI